MHTVESVLADLRCKGELWEPVPGATGMRGTLLRLSESIESELKALAMNETVDEWRLPAALSIDTLARAEYFASFPHWLTVASHLRADPESLGTVAAGADPQRDVHAALDAPSAALPPAVCYHTYAALAGQVVPEVRIMTAQGTCWRHEGGDLATLERGWAFTMREVVCIGTPAEVESFRQRGITRALELAQRLGISAEIREAADPFYAPTARGKALLQRVKGLKHELILPIGDREIAAASFNNHEAFFGTAFDIRTADDAPAASGCIAFGVERWVLAFLAAHGTESEHWPTFGVVALEGA